MTRNFGWLWITAAALGMACHLDAQATVTVPGAFETVEAPGTCFWAISPYDTHVQVLIGASQLGAARDRDIRGLRVRRNGGDPRGQAGGLVFLQVYVSNTAVLPIAARSRFDHNRGPDHRLVFQGALVVPTAPPLGSAPAPWTPPNAVMIPFNAPFRYVGATLCIETATAANPLPVPGQSPWWPLDGVVEPTGGTVETIGRSCVSDMQGTPASAEPGTLRIGGTAVFSLRGDRRAAPVVFTLGASQESFGNLVLPFDLGNSGAPGCLLYNDWLLLMGNHLAPPPQAKFGLATADVELAFDPSLLGASLFSQWLVLDPLANPLGFATTNGVRAVLGNKATQLDANWIEAPSTQFAVGRVLPGRQPVMQLLLVNR